MPPTRPPFDRGSVIVYVRQQRDADRIREYLISENVEAVAYHAGMDLKHRDMAQVRAAVIQSCVRGGWALNKGL